MPSLRATWTVSSLLPSSTRITSSTRPRGMSLTVSSSVAAALNAGSTTTSFLPSIMDGIFARASVGRTRLKSRLHGKVPFDRDPRRTPRFPRAGRHRRRRRRAALRHARQFRGRRHVLALRGELTAAQVGNRELLRAVMNGAGWRGINSEWWHFDAGDRDLIRAGYLRVL